MAVTVADTLATVNGNRATPSREGMDGRFASRAQARLGSSAIFAQTAIPSGLKEGQIKLYSGGITCERLPTEHDLERAHNLRQMERDLKPRGKIKVFSTRSLRRFMSYMVRIGRQDPPIMLTLTYREEVNWQTSKNDLRTFLMFISRKWDAAGGWRLEMQKRGVIHFHVLAWNFAHMCEGELTDSERIMKERWCKITGQGSDPDRMREGLQVTLCGNDTAARRYVAGHAAKQDQLAYGKGRHWGLFNRKKLQLDIPAEEAALTIKQVYAFNRALRNWQSAYNGGKRYDYNKRTSFDCSMEKRHARKLLAWAQEIV